VLTRIVRLLILIPAALSAQLPLTLRDAVQRAVANNPEVSAERAQRDTGGALLTAAKGAFDPVLGLQGGWRQSRTPASSVLQGVNGVLDERSWTQGISLRQRLPWLGIQLDSTIENQRIATSNPFTSLNPFYQLIQRDTVLIPLWRFRKTDAWRAELKVRRRDLRTLRQDFAGRLLDLTYRVEQAYWNLAAAQDSLTAAKQIEEAAADSLASTGRLATQGELAGADVTGARGQLARAAEARASAEGELRESIAQLKALLAPNAADNLWRETLIATERQAEPSLDSSQDLTRQALANHPDLEALSLRLESQRDQTALAAEAAAPRVDLELSRTAQGLAGRGVPQGELFPGLSLDAPPQLIGGIGRAGTQVWRNRFPTYQVGINIELPLRNRSAEGRLAEQQLLERRLKSLRQQAEIQLAAGIEQSFARMESARQRIENARTALRESELRLSSEMRLFREGQSTNLNLNTRQNELAQSRQLAVAAARAYNLAVAELRRISAQSFQTFAITLD
jgi:outer membrane protein